MAAHRYWRIHITAIQGLETFMAMAEVQMRTSVGGADQCTGGTASASDEFSASFAASKAVDDDAATAWSCNTATNWWKYDFGTAKDIVEYTIQAHNSVPDRSPKDFTLQWSDDDTNWTTADTQAGITGWTAGMVKTFVPGRFIYDTFTEGADKELSLHAPDQGGAWSKHPSYTQTATVRTAEGRLQGATWSQTSVYINAAAAPTADCVVEFTARSPSTISWNRAGVVLRHDPTANTGYHVYTNWGTWYIDRINAGVSSNVAQFAQSLSANTDYAVLVRLTGDAIELVVDGTTVLYAIDPVPITAIGRVGVLVREDSRVDNFVARTETATATPYQSQMITEAMMREAGRAQWSQSAVEALIIPHGDSQWSQVMVEIMTKIDGTPPADTTMSGVASITVALSGRLGNDMVATAAIGVSTSGEMQLGTELGEAAAQISVTAEPPVLDHGTELGGTANVTLAVPPPSLETGIALQALPATIAITAEGSLAGNTSLSATATVAVSTTGALELGEELRGTASVQLNARGTLVVYPESPAGFFLLF